ncbi:MAG: hypothetical protein ACRBK7_30880 [Acidimicrobiales bacterium]
MKKLTAGLAAGVATTAGKVVIGTALAAAAVGGAHATEVVEVPGLPEQSSGRSTGQVPTQPDLPDQSNGPATLEVRGSDGSDSPESSDNADANSHGKAVSEFVATTDLEGCERGQATAGLASSKAADNRQDSETDKDPCVKADGAKGDDAGKPADGGKPEDTGKPADGGKPEDAGKSDDAGKPADAGKPDGGGKPEDAGKPDDAGKSADPGKPAEPGKPG